MQEAVLGVIENHSKYAWKDPEIIMRGGFGGPLGQQSVPGTQEGRARTSK